MYEVMVEICCEHSEELVANYLNSLAIPEKPVAGFETATQHRLRYWACGDDLHALAQ